MLSQQQGGGVANAGSTGTRVTLGFVGTGFLADGFAALAPQFDAVLAQQIRLLKGYVEQGGGATR